MQTTGEAQYLDDLPLRGDALHAAFVLSSQANATIDGIDAAAALSMTGVKGFISVESMIEDGYGNMVG
jgi:xanthine dehydrogenase molybdopterin-binding subunit B